MHLDMGTLTCIGMSCFLAPDPWLSLPRWDAKISCGIREQQWDHGGPQNIHEAEGASGKWGKGWWQLVPESNVPWL